MPEEKKLYTQLKKLEELQKIDKEIIDLEKIAEQDPKKVKELKDDVARIETILNKEKDRLVESEKWKKEHESDLKLQEELLAKSRTKISQVRNEKESTAVQKEIEINKKAIQEREEELLKMMEVVEEYKKAIEEHKKYFEELKTVLAQAESDLDKSIQEFNQKKSEKEIERKKITAEIDSEYLSIYEKIRKRKGIAIVEVKGETCQGCNMKIPPQLYIEILREEKVITCPYCYRILFNRDKANPQNEESK